MANIEKNIDTSGIITLDYGSFKAVCIGAKDCKAPIATSIQGDQGCISIQTPANVLKGFKVLYNDQREEEFDLQGDTHRMIYEFKEFMRIMKEKDVKKQKEMLDLSLLISKLMEEGRMQEGIVFDNDK